MLIRQPTIRLISRPTIEHENLDDWMICTGHDSWDYSFWCDPDVPAVFGGRICYDSFNKGRKDEDYLPHIIGQKHGSVLEHCCFGIALAGVTRSLTHELVRHRHFGFSEQSQRYVLVPGNFVVPPEMSESEVPEWYERQRAKHEQYLALLTRELNRGKPRKVAHGIARSELPESTETRIFVTGNLRAWRGFFDQRISTHADAEIRRAATLVFEQLEPYTTCLDDYQQTENGLWETDIKKV